MNYIIQNACISSPDESVPQSGHKLEQVQHRILSYAENWPPLRRWFSKYKVISNINANLDLQSVCDAATQVIQEVVNKVRSACILMYVLLKGMNGMFRISKLMP